MMTPTDQINQLQKLLPDDLFDSKDWRAGDIVERVGWLLTMYEQKKEELEYSQESVDILLDRLALQHTNP